MQPPVLVLKKCFLKAPDVLLTRPPFNFLGVAPVFPFCKLLGPSRLFQASCGSIAPPPSRESRAYPQEMLTHRPKRWFLGRGHVSCGSRAFFLFSECLVHPHVREGSWMWNLWNYRFGSKIILWSRVTLWIGRMIFWNLELILACGTTSEARTFLFVPAPGPPPLRSIEQLDCFGNSVQQAHWFGWQTRVGISMQHPQLWTLLFSHMHRMAHAVASCAEQLDIVPGPATSSRAGHGNQINQASLVLLPRGA